MFSVLPVTRLLDRQPLHREIVRVQIVDEAPRLRRRGQGRVVIEFQPLYLIIVYDYRKGRWRASNTIIRGPRLDDEGVPCGNRFAEQYFPLIRLPLAPWWVRALVDKYRPVGLV